MSTAPGTHDTHDDYGFIRANVSYEEYARMPGERISSLKEMLVSPLRYRYRLDYPKSSKPLTLGTAAHCAVLEPERFKRDYLVWDERTEGGDLRPRRGKDWESFKGSADGRAIITADEYAHAVAVQRAVRADAMAMTYLRTGAAEVSMCWRDTELGTPMKGRVDWMTTGPAGLAGPVLVGLKTTRDVRHEMFGKQAAQFHYAMSWAGYVDGYEALTGTLPTMIEVVVESAPPHDVGVYLIPSDVLEQGRLEYRDALAKLAECRERDEWPGAVPQLTRLALPMWAYERDQDDVDEDGELPLREES